LTADFLMTYQAWTAILGKRGERYDRQGKVRDAMAIASRWQPWVGALRSLPWATRTLRSEVVGFWSDRNAFVIVPSAGPRESLHYYVYSDHLSWDAMKLDPQGIPLYRGRLFGYTYSPPYIAWYGLVHLEQYLRGTNPAGQSVFLKQVEWLEAHAVRQPRGETIWPMTFDWREGRCDLKAPWVSAYAQGLVISALVRAYRITGREELLDLCRSAADVFRQDVKAGGVRSIEERGVFYAEYPCSGAPRILDGFLSSLLGLYDLFAQTEDPLVFELFSEGVKGLRHLLPYWSYREKWGWYGSRYYLCSPGYHQLNRALLLAVSKVGGEPALERCARMWDPARLTMAGRLEVFMVFVLTKNLSRLKYQTWREKTNASLRGSADA